MHKKYYDKYHDGGAGRSVFVEHKGIPLNNAKKAAFVEKCLKGKILDGGCGLGFDVNYFHSRGHDIEGTDISDTAIDSAKNQYPEINFFIHDFEKAKLQKKYDTICCFEVIEHIFDYKNFLKNIRDSLVNDGLLIISTPNIFGLASYIRLLLRDGSVFGITATDDSHIRFFSVGTLEKTLVGVGFEIEKVQTFSSSNVPLLPTALGGSIVIIAKKAE
jgi:2-polyprenyl-3-methyl-5-hydroxy-6-metoxy-1,4-benzoquinol methylase